MQKIKNKDFIIVPLISIFLSCICIFCDENYLKDINVRLFLLFTVIVSIILLITSSMIYKQKFLLQSCKVLKEAFYRYSLFLILSLFITGIFINKNFINQNIIELIANICIKYIYLSVLFIPIIFFIIIFLIILEKERKINTITNLDIDKIHQNMSTMFSELFLYMNILILFMMILSSYDNINLNSYCSLYRSSYIIFFIIYIVFEIVIWYGFAFKDEISSKTFNNCYIIYIPFILSFFLLLSVVHNKVTDSYNAISSIIVLGLINFIVQIYYFKMLHKTDLIDKVDKSYIEQQNINIKLLKYLSPILASVVLPLIIIIFENSKDINKPKLVLLSNQLADNSNKDLGFLQMGTIIIIVFIFVVTNMACYQYFVIDKYVNTKKSKPIKRPKNTKF